MSEAGAARNRIPHVGHNFTINVLDGAIFAFGMNLASRTTVLPIFVQKLGGSNVAIGMLPVLWVIGFNMPQLFIANHARQVRSKKRLVLQTGLVQRLPWLVLATLTVGVIWHVPPVWGLTLFFTLFAAAAVGGSLNLPGWFDLVAKLTPVRMRGRLFALRAVLGGILGMLAGHVVGTVLDGPDAAQGFAMLFGLAFAATMVSYGLLTRIKEEAPPLPPRRIDYRVFLRQLPRILKKDRNYRNFLVGDTLLISALMAEAFFAVYALQRFALTDAAIGTFIMVLTASAAVGSLIFGYLADRYGHRINLVIAAGATFLACMAALFAPTPELYLIVFVGSSFAMGLPAISRLPIIAELCTEEDRPTYVALTNAITAPFALTGLLAGLIADRLGYEPLFVVTAFVAFAAMVWILTMVREPRNGVPQLRPKRPDRIT
jgi:MFS family permease